MQRQEGGPPASCVAQALWFGRPGCGAKKKKNKGRKREAWWAERCERRREGAPPPPPPLMPAHAKVLPRPPPAEEPLDPNEGLLAAGADEELREELLPADAEPDEEAAPPAEEVAALPNEATEAHAPSLSAAAIACRLGGGAARAAAAAAAARSAAGRGEFRA